MEAELDLLLLTTCFKLIKNTLFIGSISKVNSTYVFYPRTWTQFMAWLLLAFDDMFVLEKGNMQLNFCTKNWSHKIDDFYLMGSIR